MPIGPETTAPPDGPRGGRAWWHLGLASLRRPSDGLPDLSRRYEPLVECLKLAFIAFNAPHFADFVVEQPTPVVEDGQERCQVFHYSNPISLAAKNALFALDDA